MSGDPRPRRRLIHLLGVGLGGALAGCSGSETGDDGGGTSRGTDTATPTTSTTPTTSPTTTLSPTSTPTPGSSARELAADDGDSGDQFGIAVAVADDGTTALVGAPGSPDAGRAGAAYVFDLKDR